MRPFVEIVKEIRDEFPHNPYDHRPFMIEQDPDWVNHGRDSFRSGYAAFKHQVAKTLQPKRILEIGVGPGTAALAFADACPGVEYVGMDVLEMQQRHGHRITERVFDIMQERGVNARLEVVDTQRLHDVGKFRGFDLAHIDGSHAFNSVCNDLRLCWRAEIPWILCDDAKDLNVMSGIFHCIRNRKRQNCEWAYFENTTTGSVLIHRT